MNKLIAWIFLFVVSCQLWGAAKGNLRFVAVEYNCENLFDTIDNPLTDDDEFLLHGVRGWASWRYWKKLNHIAQAIMSCGMQDKDIVPVDIVGLCEVESDTALYDLTHRSLLRNMNYSYIMTNSPDQRGINVALLYDPVTFSLLSYNSIRMDNLRETHPTRDILYAKGLLLNDDTMHVFVVHAPSRRGGESLTMNYRMMVAERLVGSIDSIRSSSSDANILVMGDFNDYSKDKPLRYIQRNGMKELKNRTMGQQSVHATYRHQGIWGSLDHMFVSDRLSRQKCDSYICAHPFLLTPDERYGGYKPFRTYEGYQWYDGYSDHLPLVIYISLQ